MSDFDAKFMQDEDLRDLLRQWNVPKTPDTLDNRVAAAYQQSRSGGSVSDMAFNPTRDSEVVKMKFCKTCQEEFAERFSFCPVDGTPLTAVSTAPVSDLTSQPEPIMAAEAVAAPKGKPSVLATARMSAAAGIEHIGEYHLTSLEDRGLAARLADELGNVAHNYQLTWPEFKRDPFGFVKRSIQGYGSMVGRFFSSRDAVIALLLSVVAMAVLVGAIFLLDRSGAGGPSKRTMIAVAVVGFVGLLAIF